MAKNYFELNTNLDINQTAIVPALNGRQGDNDREVGFWIKDGKFPMDLSNKTIKLFAKDAAGVVKETESINDRTGITAGRFTLLVQKEFYQAVGQVEDSFIQISDTENGQIVSTIPVSFTVLENKMVVTQTQSQLYLDTVQKVIDDFNERIKSAGTNLEVLENAQKHLQSVVDNINQEFNSDLFAKTKEDNNFKGDNTFEKPIQATGGVVGNLKGKADSSGQSDEATHAMKADNAGKADEATHAIDADNAKNADLANRLNSTYSQTIKDLTVSKLNITGQSKNNVFRKTSVSVGNSKAADLFRVGNVVMCTMPAQAWGNSDIEAWSVTPITVPVGYRPVSVSTLSFVNNWKSGLLTVFTDGSVHSTDFGIIGRTAFEAYGVWITDDDFPG